MAIFDEPSRQPLPQPTFEDVTRAGRKALVSMIPFVGGPASELLGLLSSPVEQRRDDWLEDAARRLHDLEGIVKGFQFDDLANNEQFVSATLQATQAALRTHQKEKLEALRNAVLNVAAGYKFSEEQQGLFLSLVDSLQPIHLYLLKEMHKKQERVLLHALLQELITHARFKGFETYGIQSLLEDLARANLIRINGGAGPLIPAFNGHCTTSWGEEFLRFISPLRASNDQ